MKHKIIKELGLQVTLTFSGEPVVDADSLEALLQKGVSMFGSECNNLPVALSLLGKPRDTHSGLLIGYAPIPKLEPVNLKEVIEKLEDVVTCLMDKTEGAFKRDTITLIERLKSAGVAK
jgi:hypothetical protein